MREKVKKVIESCKTIEQLQAAERYLLLAEKKMGKEFALRYLIMTKSRELWIA